MAVASWILDKSAAARAEDPVVGPQLIDMAGSLFVCAIGELEQLYSVRSAPDYDAPKAELHANFDVVPAPQDVLDREQAGPLATVTTSST